MNCSKCNGEVRYIEQYQRYYCDRCAAYVDPVAQAQPVAQQSPPQAAVVSSASHKLDGKMIPLVTLDLRQGETIRAQPGVMIYRDPTVQMQTRTHGGVMKGLGRAMLGGENISQVEFTGPGKIAFSAGTPGEIMPIVLNGDSVRAKSGAFIACDMGVEMEVTTEKIGTAIIGGTGLFQLRFYGRGTVYIQAKGDIIPGTLQAGQSIVADENAFLGCDDSVQRNRERVQGFRNVLTGGEGLYLLKMTGLGRYWLESGGGLIDWVKQIAKQ